MARRILAPLVLLLPGCGYWLLVSRLARVPEPWDAQSYWSLWYPLALALSAAAGPLLGKRGWMAGAIGISAQLPVMWATRWTGEMWQLGVLTAIVLAIPASALSALTGWLATRRKNG